MIPPDEAKIFACEPCNVTEKSDLDRPVNERRSIQICSSRLAESRAGLGRSIESKRRSSGVRNLSNNGTRLTTQMSLQCSRLLAAPPNRD
jgi:hypothetical protein